ncbi:sigma-54-dependent Fis family transcriptional regulator [Serpens gallinarum]|uniref:Sigma-54-dependent Fis family transcriptional regulator n=1 Tax=Serpens gallinarum TaxID=2763075 RepID=A0ABR8TNU2_9PSED|nr:sigma-54-dependent Fis family transcriptional regulator [Serpens gallinarum]MBD7977426.1 sigma-54-dependent Fis family transcriptional regulator [Serpens gallinarum]
MTASTHEALIRDSWTRCEGYGLTHRSPPRFSAEDGLDITTLLHTQHTLLHTTQREVLPYYENILANSRCLVLLTDAQGLLLHSWGDRRNIEPALQPGFSLGASWLERHCGTNAIGTALACEQALHIQRDEHFLEATRCLSSAAAPICDAQRRVIGVLDVSSDSYLPPSHTLGLVKMLCQSVENRLLLDQFHREHHQLVFNTGQDNLDSPWAGLLLFDDSGWVVAANRRADSLLGTTAAQTHLERLFDTPLRLLLDLPEKQPLLLHSTGQVHFHGQVRKFQRPGPVVTAAQRVWQPLTLSDIDLGDAQVHKLVDQALRLLEKDIPLLIHGETGVGKDVLVKALHQASSRAGRPLVAVNCAALPTELVESELFGYEKGAFTGAHQKGSLGLIRKADKGLLFLDEIGDMPLNVQARLLRVLQERCVQPLGGGDAVAVDFRLICATNRPLREEVAAGRFRADLYYRICGLGLKIPPLRQRSDKLALIQRVWEQHRAPRQTAGLSPEVMALFLRHSWPGNLRQLSNVLKIALALADDQSIRVEHLPEEFFGDLQPASGPQPQAHLVPTDIANDTLINQLQACGGNVSRLARSLGISRTTLYKRLRESMGT